jgi:hypothetical protein
LVGKWIVVARETAYVKTGVVEEIGRDVVVVPQWENSTTLATMDGCEVVVASIVFVEA